MRIPGPWSDHYMPLFFIGRYLFCFFPPSWVFTLVWLLVGWTTA